MAQLALRSIVAAGVHPIQAMETPGRVGREAAEAMAVVEMATTLPKGASQ